jgi:hypothetical protein
MEIIGYIHDSQHVSVLTWINPIHFPTEDSFKIYLCYLPFIVLNKKLGFDPPLLNETADTKCAPSFNLVEINCFISNTESYYYLANLCNNKVLENTPTLGATNCMSSV